jgi:hypothetical protein
MIGYFINTTAVRTQLEPADTFAALAKRVSGGVLAALERNLLPFSEVRGAGRQWIGCCCWRVLAGLVGAVLLLVLVLVLCASVLTVCACLQVRNLTLLPMPCLPCLVQVVTAAGVARSPGVNPIFQV